MPKHLAAIFSVLQFSKNTAKTKDYRGKPLGEFCNTLLRKKKPKNVKLFLHKPVNTKIFENSKPKFSDKRITLPNTAPSRNF